MKIERKPVRTCIGCRGKFGKGEVVRIAAGTNGAVVIDYRERLPGRGAYLCPRNSCITRALQKGIIGRSLRSDVRAPGAEELISLLTAAVHGRIRSLLSGAAGAGKLSVGLSAVQEGMERGRIKAVLFAADVSSGSREKVAAAGAGRSVRTASLFTKDEMGRIMGREAVGVAGIEDDGIARAIWREIERLKNLINGNQ